MMLDIDILELTLLCARQQLFEVLNEVYFATGNSLTC